MKYVKIICLSILVVSLSLILLQFATRSQNNDRQLRINNSNLTIEIATTLQEKQRGLCCRDSLPEKLGMLFVYDKPGNYRFWMKNTKIPLDMYWINAQKKIIYIQESVQPSSYPESFGPNLPAQYVLETNAGYAAKYKIKVGDSVTF